MPGVPIRIDIIAKDMASRVIEQASRPVKAFGAAVAAAAKVTSGTLGRTGKKTFDAVGKSVQKSTRGMQKLSSAIVSASKSMTRMAVQSKATQASVNKLTGSVKGLIVAAAGYLAIRAMSRGVMQSAAAFNVQEGAVRGLSKALELNGEFTQAALDKHKAFASQMQETFNVGDEVALSMMKQASMLGVQEDQLQNVTKTAIGLAEATGIDLETAMKRTVGAMSGTMGELGELIPAIKNATTEEGKLAAVTEIAAKGLAQKQATANTLEGAMQRASNTFGDLKEKIGELLAPILTVALNGIQVLSTVLIDVVDNMITAAGGLDVIGAAAKGFVDNIVEKFIAGFTFLEVVFTNFGTVVNIAMSTAKLFIIGFVEDVKYFFTVKLVSYFVWFGENFFNIIRDAFMAVVTVVYNRMRQIADTIITVIKFILSGGEGGVGGLMNNLGEIMGRNLLDGFEATTEALPDVADRALTATEKRMRANIDEMTGKLKAEFDKKFDDRMDLMKGKTASDADLGLQGLTPTKGGVGGLDSQAANAFSARLLTRGPGEASEEVQLLRQIQRNTEETKNNTKTIAERSPTDGEDETEISMEVINGGQ